VNKNQFNKSIDNFNLLIKDSIPGIPKVSKTVDLNVDYLEDLKPKTFIPILQNEQLWSCLTFEEALLKLATPYAVEDDYIYLLPPASSGQKPIASRFIIDGDLRSWPWVKPIIPRDLLSITFVNYFEGFKWFNMDVRGGVVFITKQDNIRTFNLAKKYYNWQKIYKYDKSLVPVSIYRPNNEFYNPDKTEPDLNPTMQIRPTIYWKSSVSFNGKGPVKIKIPNQNHQGKVIITVNGVSENNLVGTGKARYEVKNITK